jgi:hypothetical protein
MSGNDNVTAARWASRILPVDVDWPSGIMGPCTPQEAGLATEARRTGLVCAFAAASRLLAAVAALVAVAVLGHSAVIAGTGQHDPSLARYRDGWRMAGANPHLPPELQGRTKEYLRKEFAAFPPDKYAHIGWQGAAREAADVPPEMAEAMAKLGPRPASRHGKSWTFSPQANYAIYRYATVFGNAKDLVPRLRRWQKARSDDELAAMPFVHNAYLAGLAGIVGLSDLAGQPDASAKAELDRLLALRAARFTRDRPAFDKKYDGVFNVGGGTAVPLTVSRNFMFMVPEVADYLRAKAMGKVKEACCHYNDEVLPYWFVAKAEQGDGENTFSVLFDYHALFQAKAMILKEPYEGLVKFLDVPAFYRGDLYYIDNLCAALEASAVGKTATKE